MIAGEFDGLGAEQLAQRDGGPVGEQVARVRADADHHPRRRQRLDVGHVAGGRPQLVAEEPGGLAQLLLGRCMRLGVAGAPSRTALSNPALTMNLHHAACMPSAWNVAMMSVGLRALLGGVGQQLEQRRLVRDQCAHPSGMPGNQRQPRHRAAAGAEDVRGLGAERIQHGGHVVGTKLGVESCSGSSIALAAIPRGS